MAEITVNGASDDLIEIGGAIREEFTLKEDEEGDLLAFSNGVVLRIRYTNDGVWRIEPLASRPGDELDIVPAVGEDDDNYSDEATFLVDGKVWVVHGTEMARS